MTLIFFTALMTGTAHADAPPDFNKLVDAIYRAEGGKAAKKPFGILSVKCDDYSDCRQIALNTVRNNWRRWENKTHGANRHANYFNFLASRYCPVGAANDPQGLNRNWLNNVRYFYNQK
jgi:hypothetical protein